MSTQKAELLIGEIELNMSEIGANKHLFYKRQKYNEKKELVDWTDEKGQPQYLLKLSIVTSSESRYGNNIGVSISQTEEERAAKAHKTYVANGKVFWTTEKGEVFKAYKEDSNTQSQPAEKEDDEDDLPF